MSDKKPIRVKPNLDKLAPRRKLKAVVKPPSEWPRKRRRVPAPVQLEEREFCLECGDPFAPGRGPGERDLCPLCNGNRQMAYQTPRRRALGVSPMAAFQRPGDFSIDDEDVGPVERVKGWARRTFGRGD